MDKSACIHVRNRKLRTTWKTWSERQKKNGSVVLLSGNISSTYGLLIHDSSRQAHTDRRPKDQQKKSDSLLQTDICILQKGHTSVVTSIGALSFV